jgi:multidrug transporter EmrE-like cation transporter
MLLSIKKIGIKYSIWTGYSGFSIATVATVSFENAFRS